MTVPNKNQVKNLINEINLCEELWSKQSLKFLLKVTQKRIFVDQSFYDLTRF